MKYENIHAHPNHDGSCLNAQEAICLAFHLVRIQWDETPNRASQPPLSVGISPDRGSVYLLCWAVCQTCKSNYHNPSLAYCLQ